MPLLEAAKTRLSALFAIEGSGWERLVRPFIAAAAVFCLLVVFISPWKVLGFFLGCGLLAAAYARPAWTTVFLAAYIPFEPFLLKFVPDELYIFAKYFSEGLIYLLLGVVLFRRWWNREARPATPIDVPFLLLVLVAAASSVANFIAPEVAILGTRQIVRFILLFFAVVAMRPTRGFIRTLAMAMLAIALLQSALGVLQALSGGTLDTYLIPSERRVYDSIQFSGTEQFWAPGQRVFGTLGRYDQLGTFLTFFLLLAAGWLYEIRQGKWRRYLFLFFALGGIALALTYSRSSWFGFLLGFIVIAVKHKRDRKVLLGLGLAALLIAAYTAYSGVVVRYLIDLPKQTILARLLEAFSYERYRGEYFGYGRVYWFIQTPLTVVPAAPIFGHGPAQYGGGAAAILGNTKVYDALGLPFGVYGTEGYIDNNWFSLWGEVGTLGLGLYLWMMVVLYRTAWKLFRGSRDPLMRGLGLGYMGALLAFALQAMLGTYLEVRTIGLYVWLFGALVIVAAQRERLIDERSSAS